MKHPDLAIVGTLITLLLIGVLLGVAIVSDFGPFDRHKEGFISEHHDKPFCVDVDMVDGKKERCWRAVEVTP